MISGRVPTIVMTLSIDRLTNDRELPEHLLNLLDVQLLGVVRGVVIEVGIRRITLDEISLIVEMPRIRRDAIVTAQVLGARHLLPGDKRFVQLFTMPRADDTNLTLG